MPPMLRHHREMPDVEDEWDPQGLNSLNKTELESFSSDGEDEEAPVIPSITDDEQSRDLDLDGLTELEQMERNLLNAESFDFVMVGEEE